MTTLHTLHSCGHEVEVDIHHHEGKIYWLAVCHQCGILTHGSDHRPRRRRAYPISRWVRMAFMVIVWFMVGWTLVEMMR